MKFKEGKILKKFIVEKNGRKINVIFRYPRMSDAKDLMKFINALVEENAPILAVKKVTLAEEKKWLRTTISDIRSKKKLTILAEVDGRIIGNVGLNRGRYGSSHVGTLNIAISKRHRGIGIGKQLVKFIMELSVKEFGIELLRIEYLKGNAISKHLYEKLGFKQAGTIPKIRKRGKHYDDEIFMYKEV